jgi:hypothetical protein
MEHIAEDRTLKSLTTYHAGIAPASAQGTKAVAEDLWKLHIRATRSQIPEAD